jgi:hypothetical protein
MFLCFCDFYLFPFYETVFVPGKSSVYPEILNVSFRAVNVMWFDLDPLAVILNFLNRVWIANGLAYSLCQIMSESQSVASNAVSSTKVAVTDSGDFGMAAVYSSYNNGPRPLQWGTQVLTVDSSVYSF